MIQYDRLFKKEKITEYDIYCLKGTVNEIQLRGFDVEIVREPVKAVGYAVRVLSREGERIGIGLASCSDETKLQTCIHNAKFFSTLNRQEMKYEFPTQKPDTQVATVDNTIRDSASEAIGSYTESLLNNLKTEAQSSIPVKPTFGKIRTYFFETSIENSAGMSKRKTETYFYLELALKVSDGAKLAEFWPRKYRRRIDGLKVEDILPHWTKLARDTLQAQMAPTGKMTVILNPESLCNTIVPTVGTHARAEQKFKNQSLFKKDQSVASEDLSISDDGLLDYGLSSACFDDEGNPQQRTRIIEKGVFKSFLYDQKYALMLKEKPTGNGVKPIGGMVNPLSKFNLAVIGSPTNISITPGKQSYDELIGEVEKGLLIEQFSWLNPDPYSSGFSSEVRNAYLIENGEVKQAVKGGLVAGKVFDLIKNISGISKSAEIESGASAFSCVSPYIRFDNVQVAGK